MAAGRGGGNVVGVGVGGWLGGQHRWDSCSDVLFRNWKNVFAGHPKTNFETIKFGARSKTITLWGYNYN